MTKWYGLEVGLKAYLVAARSVTLESTDVIDGFDALKEEGPCGGAPSAPSLQTPTAMQTAPWPDLRRCERPQASDKLRTHRMTHAHSPHACLLAIEADRVHRSDQRAWEEVVIDCGWPCRNIDHCNMQPRCQTSKLWRS